MIKLLVCFTVAAFIVLFDSHTAAQAAATETIDTAAGTVVGSRGRDNARAWYGIPYAEPPLADLRWRAPRLKSPWLGTYAATDTSRRCIQLAKAGAKGQQDGTLVGSEDCLYLNVWAPSNPASTPLPVMFWLHSKDNVSGHSGQYELGRLAQQQDVIVVSVNYRLGPMGWFADPALVATAKTNLDKSVNFGTLDIIAALDWVNSNIAKFGGNADNITLFGSGAGGSNIASLMVSPLAKGKFHRAIIQSAGFQSFSLKAMQEKTSPEFLLLDAGLSSADIISALGQGQQTPIENESTAQRAKYLRSLAPQKIFQAAASVRPGTKLANVKMMSVIADGIAIPIDGVLAQLSKPAGVHNVPLMIGSNKDELLGLGLLEEGMMDNFLKVSFWPKDKHYYQANGEYPSRFWRAVMVDGAAGSLGQHGSADIFTYRFDWDEQGEIFGNDIGGLIGAGHGLEVGFITGGFDDKVNDPMSLAFKKKNRAGREILSNTMMSYWAEFAYHGKPAQGRQAKLPQWQPWSPQNQADKTLILDTAAGGGVRMGGENETAGQIIADLKIDSRLQKGVRRCYVAQKSEALISRFVLPPQTNDNWLKSICGSHKQVPAYSE